MKILKLLFRFILWPLHRGRASIFALFLFSCKSYDFKTYNTEAIPIACSHPVYVVTGAKQSAGDGKDLSLHDLLKYAQTQYGGDVTIQNVRWDTENKKRTSAIFDVIRCNPEK